MYAPDDCGWIRSHAPCCRQCFQTDSIHMSEDVPLSVAVAKGMRAWEPLAQGEVGSTANIWSKKTDRLHTVLHSLI